MRDVATLKGLLDRVKGANGSSFAIETEIALVLDRAPDGFKYIESVHVWEQGNPVSMSFDTWMPPPYTASLGAAMALASSVLPGKHWHICAGCASATEPLYGAAFFDHGDDGVTLDEPLAIAEHEHGAALAVIAAILHALIASASVHQKGLGS